MAPQGNPSGYSQATPTGRDPTTGAILRDRFHQLRGNEFQMMEGTDTAARLAAEFLRSRGAPMTAQNLAIANSYLRGGALDALQQQQSVSDEIASQAIGAEAGGAGGGAASRPSDSVAPPPPRPVPHAVGGPNMPTPDMSMPFVLPGYRVTPEGAIDAGSPSANQSIVRAQGALTGEIVGDDGRVVGVNPGVGPRISGPDQYPLLSAPVGIDAIDAEVVDTPPRLPSPSKQTSGPTKTTTGAPINPRAAATVKPRAEDRPVATDEIVPQGGDKPAAHAIRLSTKGPNGEDVFRSGGNYVARNADGEWVKAVSMTALRKLLKSLR